MKMYEGEDVEPLQDGDEESQNRNEELQEGGNKEGEDE